MIYKSLEYIPYKLFIEIVQTLDVLLLSDEAEKDEVKLNEMWEKIFQDHLEYTKTPDSLKTFNIEKQVAYLQSMRKVILMACESLSFDWDDDLIDMLRGFGYSIRNGSADEYYLDLKKVIRESKGIMLKLNQVEKQLPKRSAGNEFKLDDVMASYSAILGIDFDYNAISYTKFFGLQKQVNAKIKSIEKNQQPKTE
jgi:hypothetical protein